MGRPQDKFCWDNVEKLPDGRWKCKHCEEQFSGAASRIRNHLSGQGNDIRSCAAVPCHIQEEALKRAAPMKRARSVGEDNDGVKEMAPLQVSSSSSSFNGEEEEIPSNNVPAMAIPNLVQVSSSSNWFNNYINANERGETSNANDVEVVMESAFEAPPIHNDFCEQVADAFVTFSMATNTSVHCIQDSGLRALLTTVAQYGLPSSLLQKNSSIIQKSLWNFEQQGILHMKMVKESWKTTGCTLMLYDFAQGENKPVLGFYCPKGFIFVELPQSINYYTVTKALKEHVLNLSMDDDDVIRYIDHFPSHSVKCLYQARRVTDELDSPCWSDNLLYGHRIRSEYCVRHSIHEELCKEICEKSKWVENLIKKSDKMYQYIVTSNLYGKYYKTLMQARREHFVEGKHSSNLARLGSIMVLEQELRCWLSSLNERDRFELENETDISTIINNYEFWYDGNELLQALTPLLDIPYLMDTLIPTAGYLYTALDKAKWVLKTYYDRRSLKYSKIWDCFQNAFSGLDVVVYLSPAYILTEVKWDIEPTPFVRWDLKSFYGSRVKEEELDAEMKDYNTKSKNPFANISVSECKANHPVRLWYKYGGRFPILQKCAIMMLSQPVSCLCNQVKKHMSQIQRSDNLALRLNYKMMQEFKSLGNDVYRPMDF